jgi:hypothetical protein
MYPRVLQLAVQRFAGYHGGLEYVVSVARDYHAFGCFGDAVAGAAQTLDKLRH